MTFDTQTSTGTETARADSLQRLVSTPVVTLISLGAGVQSSTMALMAAHGEISPMPTAAIFADTQGEPKAVMEWLDWLEAKLPYPIIRVTRGSLKENSLKVVRSKKSGNRYLKGLIPAYVKNYNGTIGLLGRKCTADWKRGEKRQLSRAAKKRLHLLSIPLERRMATHQKQDARRMGGRGEIRTRPASRSAAAGSTERNTVSA